MAMLYRLLGWIRKERSKYRDKKYIDSIPVKLKELREREELRVAFILHEAALWKTEELYVRMLEHKRFRPFLCTTLSAEGSLYSVSKKYLNLIDYLKSRSYEYSEIRHVGNLDADIIIYEKPYDEVYWPGIQARYFRGLVSYIPYGFNSYDIEGAYNTDCILRSFQFYIENIYVQKSLRSLMINKAVNTIITGIPMMDLLLKPKGKFNDPWKKQSFKKKRIIWAPHFSINSEASWLSLSSFLTLHEDMLELAVKYSENVQVAFKPHPLLFNQLIKLWGQKRAEEYYRTWDELPNGQLETGQYVDLFKHSDAMVHDCGSFLIEYLYTDNPVLYTVRDKEKTLSQINDFGKKAYDLTYHGSTPEDVEQFMKDVICGKDSMKEKRLVFKQKYLVPPGGKSACENILDAILGTSEK